MGVGGWGVPSPIPKNVSPPHEHFCAPPGKIFCTLRERFQYFNCINRNISSGNDGQFITLCRFVGTPKGHTTKRLTSKKASGKKVPIKNAPGKEALSKKAPRKKAPI